MLHYFLLVWFEKNQLNSKISNIKSTIAKLYGTHKQKFHLSLLPFQSYRDQIQQMRNKSSTVQVVLGSGIHQKLILTPMQWPSKKRFVYLLSSLLIDMTLFLSVVVLTISHTVQPCRLQRLSLAQSVYRTLPSSCTPHCLVIVLTREERTIGQMKKQKQYPSLCQRYQACLHSETAWKI